MRGDDSPQQRVIRNDDDDDDSGHCACVRKQTGLRLLDATAASFFLSLSLFFFFIAMRVNAKINQETGSQQGQDLIFLFFRSVPFRQQQNIYITTNLFFFFVNGIAHHVFEHCYELQHRYHVYVKRIPRRVICQLSLDKYRRARGWANLCLYYVQT